MLALCCERLADDWQQTYGHPVLVAESFADSQLFRGTCYKAQGWKLLGKTQGSGRSRQDYYTAHVRSVGIYYHWRRHRKNLRQSTFKDFLDAMNRFNHRLAFATITARRN